MGIQLKSFLGTGWSFPPTFDKESGSVRMSSDIGDIEESIRLILSTRPGERLVQPEFGCDLNRMVFEIIDSNLLTMLTHMVYMALLKFEPRINFIDLKVLDSKPLEGILPLEIEYTVIITNTRHNIVFPFYLLEGTNL